MYAITAVKKNDATTQGIVHINQRIMVMDSNKCSSPEMIKMGHTGVHIQDQLPWQHYH